MPRTTERAYGTSMTQEVRATAASRKKTPTLAAKSGGRSSAAPAPNLQPYQAAVQLVQQGKYEKALAAFEKFLPTAPPQVLERCRMYMQTCQRQLEHSGLAFLTPEEQFDYAISQLNAGFFEEASEQLHKLFSRHPEADYALYGLAVLDSITGRAEDCLEHLGRAIAINPRNRLQARSDNDFQSMVDDPRFTELLYPEVP